MKIELTREQIKVSNKIMATGLAIEYAILMLANIALIASGSTNNLISFLIMILNVICLIASGIAYFKYGYEKKGMYILCASGLFFEFIGMCVTPIAQTYPFAFVIMILSIIYIDIKVVTTINVSVITFLFIRILMCCFREDQKKEM